MQFQRIIHRFFTLLPLMGSEWKLHHILMAMRRGGQGTASLPLMISLTPFGLLQCNHFADSLFDSTPMDTQSKNIFLADEEREKGTSPFPPYHLPVLAAEVSHWMNASQGERIIDGTLGGGGHSELFLQQGASVIAIDRDPDALDYASSRLSAYSHRFHPWQANYAEMPHHPALQQGERVDGILLDLGLSSHQLDCAARGFSFQKEGPLDMRMGTDALCTAAEFVNQSSEEEITQCLKSLGEEPQARRIARAIIDFRKKRPFSTTSELAACIEHLIGRHGKTHPATRTFQAIRMHINQEIPMLHRALQAALICLKPGGKFLIITFNSLDDVCVKKFFHQHARETIDDPTWPSAKPNPHHYLTLPMRKSIAPGRAEILRNPRSRSAKLRVAIRNHTPITA